MRWLLALLMTALLCSALPGCQTVKGFGKDVESLGQEIQK